jgi:hypothetical protein
MTPALPRLAALLLMACSPPGHGEPVLSTSGFGAFTFGMPLASANRHLKSKIVPAPARLRVNPVCVYAAVADFPGVAFVFIDDRLQRIDVSTPAYRSTDGVAVGDMRQDVMQRLHGARREPLDHVPDGVTLVRETDARPNAIAYQLYDGRLMRMIAGDKKVIRYAEGCE